MTVKVRGAIEEVKERWLYLDEDLPFVGGVTLSEKIDAFVGPVSLFFRKKHPDLLLMGVGEVFWHTIAIAILESGTHSKDEVNAAIAKLGAKYDLARIA